MLKSSTVIKSLFLMVAAIAFQGEAHAFAQKRDVLTSKLVMSTPTTSGTGCPAGTVSATLSPDNTSLSVIFDEFFIETNAFPTIKKSCRVTIPFTIPTGFQAVIPKVEIKGFNSIPVGGYSKIQMSYSVKDRKGTRATRSLAQTFLSTNGDPVEGEFDLASETESAPITTGCGGNMNLIMDLTLSAGSNSQGDSLLSQIDSADVTSKKDVQYKLNLVSCR